MRGNGACLRAACDILAAVPNDPGRGGAALHDPCAVAWTIAPALFRTRDCPVSVELLAGPGRGRTHIDRRNRAGARRNATLLEAIDADAFFALLATRLARLP